jgi:hypothetical protein
MIQLRWICILFELLKSMTGKRRVNIKNGSMFVKEKMAGEKSDPAGESKSVILE